MTPEEIENLKELLATGDLHMRHTGELYSVVAFSSKTTDRGHISDLIAAAEAMAWRPIETDHPPSDPKALIEVYTCAPSPAGHVVCIPRRMLADIPGPAHLKTHASHWRPHTPPVINNG